MTSLAGLLAQVAKQQILWVEVVSLTPLCGGDQLDEIGAPMPNGFLGLR
jgi:hypothetical protein